ncbi:MAG: hypothetical protein ACRDNL_12280 [Spirillospora sp.]
MFIAAVAGVQVALTSIVDRWADAHNALLMFGHFTAVTASAPNLPVRSDPRPVAALGRCGPARHGARC